MSENEYNKNVLYLLGSPCKITRNGIDICGRYIGDSNLKSPIDKIILICTPCNSIIHANQSTVCFDVAEEDLILLDKYENDAMLKQEWYHKSRNEKELNDIGIFMDPDDIVPINIYE